MHSASFPLSTGRHRTGYSPNVKRTYTLWSAVQVTAQKPWHPSHIKNTHKHRPIGVAEDHTSHITQSAGVDRRLLSSRYSPFLFYLIASTCRVVRERTRHRSRYLLGTRRSAPGLWTKLSAIEPSSPFFSFSFWAQSLSHSDAQVYLFPFSRDRLNHQSHVFVLCHTRFF